MSVQTFNPDTAISLTPAAIAHIMTEITKSNDANAVRISIKPSGCSGYKYDMTLVAAPETNDVTIHPTDDLTVYLAKDSLDILKGTELDLVKQGLNSVLQFRNPNATAECGCGESFSVTK